MEKCLLLNHGERNFFIKTTYLPNVIEFARKLNIKIAVITAENPPLLELAELAKKLCTSESNETPVEYKKLKDQKKELHTLKTTFYRKIGLRAEALPNEQPFNIRKIMYKEFQDNGKVDLGEFKTRHKITLMNSLYYYLNCCKSEAEDNGYIIKKLKPKIYAMEKQDKPE